MTLTPLHIEGDRFVDACGREVMLRGVNLGGDSKLPFENGETWRNDDFSGHRSVSFVGRPFPIEEADDHFARLRGWGFNCLRLLTTWEAVEHAGRGQYDEAYLDYFAEICRRAGQYGFYVFVDFHQDVWSRMTGGSGAPGWTLETIGLCIDRLEPAGAALTMQRSFDADDPNPHQSSYPTMCWASNYMRPANGIMWSLFFGGRIATPDFRVGGEHVQDILRSSYLGAMREVAKRVADLPHVIGFDTLNEPNLGWLDRGLSEQYIRIGRGGAAISPLAALAAANGRAIDVPVFIAGESEPSSTMRLNPDSLRIWRDDMECPFEQAGIYRLEDEPVAIDEDAFRHGSDGARLDVSADLYQPFFAEVAATIRAIRPDWLVFAELEPLALHRGHQFPAVMPSGSVNALHWYDALTLFLKRIDVDNYRDLWTGQALHGRAAVTEAYKTQLGLRKAASERFGGAPTLIGEFGIPFDLDHGAGYECWRAGDHNGAFTMHEQALGMMYDAMDSLKLNATIWNYTASNRNDPRVGDGWNQEDLSIYSIDQRDGTNDGGRAVRGFARPFIRAAQGRVAFVGFDADSGEFIAGIDLDPAIAGPSEIVLPVAQFGEKPMVSCGDLAVEVADGVARFSASTAGWVRFAARR